MLRHTYFFFILLALVGCQTPVNEPTIVGDAVVYHGGDVGDNPTASNDMRMGQDEGQPHPDMNLAHDTGVDQADMGTISQMIDMTPDLDAATAEYEDGSARTTFDMQTDADGGHETECNHTNDGVIVNPGTFGGCEYTDACAQRGRRTKTVQLCDNGELANRIETTQEGCERTTEGRLLETGAFGGCAPEGDFCNPAGRQERTQSVCRDGRITEEIGTRSCRRETTALSCNQGGAQCQSGACVCPSNAPTDCSGQCVHLETNIQHCGGCDQACGDRERCMAGLCTPIRPTGCQELLSPLSEEAPIYIFTECPDFIDVGDCRSEMQTIVSRNPEVQLCPNGTGAAAGDGWCPVRGFAAACWGYVGTGGDEDTDCHTGAQAFARAYMRNARTLEEKRACAVVTAVMSHESGFAPNAKSWDMFCNGGNTGAVGLFQFDFASGLDPLPAGVDAQFEQFFRGSSGPNIAGLADFWMACNPRIAGATPSTAADLALGQTVCMQAGAPADQFAPTALGCRFSGVDPGTTVDESTVRCGVTWSDANERCGPRCMSSEDCPAGESCFADVDPALCNTMPEHLSIRCGTSWANANGRCGTRCQTDEDCPSPEMCYADLDTAICDPEPNTSSIRCGLDWTDANGRCGTFCNTDNDCPEPEACYAELDTVICAP